MKKFIIIVLSALMFCSTSYSQGLPPIPSPSEILKGSIEKEPKAKGLFYISEDSNSYYFAWEDSISLQYGALYISIAGKTLQAIDLFSIDQINDIKQIVDILVDKKTIKSEIIRMLYTESLNGDGEESWTSLMLERLSNK